MALPGGSGTSTGIDADGQYDDADGNGRTDVAGVVRLSSPRDPGTSYPLKTVDDAIESGGSRTA